MTHIKQLFAGIALTAALASPALALEYPIGVPQNKAGMEIAAVYLQPVEMEPDGMMRKASESDIHIEADIHALANNPNGFEEGAWIPYLVIKYEVSKIGSDFRITGEFMPMVANDGPHYGDNIKLAGPGKYKVKYSILPLQRTSTRTLAAIPTVQPAFARGSNPLMSSTNSPTPASARRAGTEHADKTDCCCTGDGRAVQFQHGNTVSHQGSRATAETG